MAEFKISRIRYTWRNAWTTGTTYNRDDVVSYGGSSWVCFRQHTAGIFATDQTFLANPNDTDPTPAWRKMTDGYAFRNTWQSATLYNPGDIVINGGNLYLCITSHTSSFAGFDVGISNWVVYASSSSWTNNYVYNPLNNPQVFLNTNGTWQSNVRYSVGDVAKYNGIVYRCISGHTASPTGLEIDQDKWEIFYEGVEYRGEWATGTRYRVNDLVTYGGTVFRCKQGHTPGTNLNINFNQSENWEIEFPGFQYSEEWVSNQVYQVGDLVKHGGWLYYSRTTNYNSNPSTNQSDWTVAAKGINFRGDWSVDAVYKTGDVVRRGGNIYTALIDIVDDGSSLDYLDSSNWELLTVGQNWRNFWQSGELYSPNDLVIYLGNTYQCNLEHESSDQNYPGDNGSGFNYWDLVLQSGSEAGLSKRGDLLTYDLGRTLAGDGSTFSVTSVNIGEEGQLVSINENSSVTYRTFGETNRVVYVELTGVDDVTDPQRGVSPFKPWRTIRFACERLNDNFTGTSTIHVGAGRFDEILPIIIPARTVVLGTELRTTVINAAGPIDALALDSTYTIAVLNRISDLIPNLVAGSAITKTIGNPENPVVPFKITTIGIPFSPPQYEQVSFSPPQFNINGDEIFQQGDEIFQSTNEITETLVVDTFTIARTETLINNIIDYINFFINSTGVNPSLSGSNTAATDETVINVATALEQNRKFLQEEAVAFMNINFPAYEFDSNLCKRDVDRYIDAWKYDIVYIGNYKSLMAARYYRNAVLGSTGEDMFYCRDATGVRNCTLTGLAGSLNPANVADIFRLPTGGAYISLDPGWGPADNRTWIQNRSPYIQGVTTFGTGCIGQKIDGSLHNSGNKSIVSNDFTQVISDGVGAWVTNNGRAELVSVFTYYAHIGYLTQTGGVIRATNGNCSYGRFGAIADGVDLTEVPTTAAVYTRAQQAIVASAFAGDFVDEIQILEWTNAGEDYTSATASFVGAGVDAEVVFEDFRDDAVFEARRLDTSTTIAQTIGGGGYSIIQNNAQTGNLTSITIATNDPNEEENYLGMRVVLTSGPGTGQYGYITGYNNVSKLVTVARESDNQPGWDHVVPGKPSTNPLTTGTTYRIEPRVIFSAPNYSATEVVVPVNTTWSDIAYGETTEVYLNLSAGPGTGTVVGDDGLVPVDATFNVTKVGRNYTVAVVNGGAGYELSQELVISGEDLGGETPLNDLLIIVTAISNDSTNSIVTAEQKTFGTGEDNEASSGRFVVVSSGGSAGLYSSDGETWESFALPSSGDWKCAAAGNNRFVAIQTGSNAAASSLDGITWTAQTMPANRNWNSVVYGGGIFVAVAGNLDAGAISINGTTWTSTTLPDIGDSTFNEWMDITYGARKFVAVSNSGNFVAVGTYNSETTTISWTPQVMDVISDSTEKSWQSIAYGNNRFVAISATGEVAYSFDAVLWNPATMPTQDGSTAHNWKKIRYAQGVFFAIGDTGSRIIAADETLGPTTFAATSFDGIVWTNRELDSDESWTAIGFGNPYVASRDSTVGKKSPMWVAIPASSNKFNKIQTGARALGRAIVTAGVISEIRLWDTGSGYSEGPSITLVDPNNTGDVVIEARTGDGVLTNPTWINRGLGYRTASTRVTITGNGYADVVPSGKFIVINDLETYPGPGAQLTIQGLPGRYTLVAVTPIGQTDRGLAARIRISPEIKVRDNLQHLTPVTIRTQYSQCRITGHDFLDIGTGNFEETNYPELYSGFYVPAPENEIVEEDGGRVFYTSTDQSGNFRTGELFAVEQATGTVTISADFFDFSGLTELRLGGIRVGGTGAVVREFSTDPLFSEDSNNIVPTQRAIRAYLAGRLSIGGSEIAVGSFIAGTVLVGPSKIGNTAGIKVIIPVRADFVGEFAGISGSMLAQTMFYKSF
jgi:hypothetical protein